MLILFFLQVAVFAFHQRATKSHWREPFQKNERRQLVGARRRRRRTCHAACSKHAAFKYNSSSRRPLFLAFITWETPCPSSFVCGQHVTRVRSASTLNQQVWRPAARERERRRAHPPANSSVQSLQPAPVYSCASHSSHLGWGLNSAHLQSGAKTQRSRAAADAAFCRPPPLLQAVKAALHSRSELAIFQTDARSRFLLRTLAIALTTASSLSSSFGESE